ncbi:MAG: methyltransferase domain-containing protein [Planctomycetes bacterium]|nr:methyltransferase domain-containing protein [Planctomycetota bacterium]
MRFSSAARPIPVAATAPATTVNTAPVIAIPSAISAEWSILQSNTFNEVFASQILEHLNNFHNYISEIYRILKPNGLLIVYAPFFLNTKYFGEPDHKIPFSIRTFDNYEYIGNRKLKFYEKWKSDHRTNYKGKAQFEVIEKKFITSHFAALKWMDFIVNIEPVIYERFFAGIFSPEEVYFKLRAVK